MDIGQFKHIMHFTWVCVTVCTQSLRAAESE